LSTAHLDAIEAALLGAGLAGTAAWPAWQLQVPASPDRVVVIRPTGGPEPEAGRDRPTYQLEVRGARGDVDGPFVHAELIRRQLPGLLVDGFSVFRATQSCSVGLGPDGSNRFSWVVNFRGYEV
jgi:hypothetical protein